MGGFRGVEAAEVVVLSEGEAAESLFFPEEELQRDELLWWEEEEEEEPKPSISDRTVRSPAVRETGNPRERKGTKMAGREGEGFDGGGRQQVVIPSHFGRGLRNRLMFHSFY